MKRIAMFLLILPVIAVCTVESQWWSVTPTTASLDPVFAGKSDSWKIIGGDFEIARDADLGVDVLTVATNQTLTLEGQTRYGGAQEIRTRVRLRTVTAPSSSATFEFGMTNAAAATFSVSLSASKGYDLVNANVYQSGKPLHDITALSAKMDWTPMFSSDFSYNLRAYQKIQPGWEESFRTQV